jgi:hypothetical protein
MKKILALLCLFGTANAEVTTYCCDQAAEDAYLTALAEIVPIASNVVESFEYGPWESTHGTISTPAQPQPSVFNQGITWLRPGAGLLTSIGGGDTHDGLWLMYVQEFGIPYHPHPDGYTMVSDGPLYGIGGWFTGNRAELTFTVDGDPDRVDFTGAEKHLSTGWKFLGFIDTDSFSIVDIMAVEEIDELTYFWSDDFTIGGPYFGEVKEAKEEEEDEELEESRELYDELKIVHTIGPRNIILQD